LISKYSVNIISIEYRNRKICDIEASLLRTRCRKHAIAENAAMFLLPLSEDLAYHNKMLSYRRETALQSALWFSSKVEHWNFETMIYGHYRSIFNHCHIICLKICRIP